CSAMAAEMVVLPVPPLPATKTIRRVSSASSVPASGGGARLLAGRAGCLEHRRGVAGGLDRAPLLLHGAALADQERAPLHALVRSAVQGLVDPQVERA